MRVDGNAHGVQNLDQHKDNEELIEHDKRLSGDAPVSDAVPKHFAGVCDGGQRGYKKQYGEDGIDDDLGVAQIIAKVDAKLFLGHIRLLAEPVEFAPIHGQSITTTSFLGKQEGVRTRSVGPW